MVAQVSTYTVVVTRGERYWLVHVPEVERSTQARHLREVDAMARDLVATMRDVPPESFELDVDVRVPEEANQHLARSKKLFEEADQARAAAAAEVRAAARSLKDQGLPLRDIGLVLGVSYQRAGQLAGA